MNTKTPSTRPESDKIHLREAKARIAAILGADPRAAAVLAVVQSIYIPKEHKWPAEDFQAIRAVSGDYGEVFPEFLLNTLRAEVERRVAARPGRGQPVPGWLLDYVQKPRLKAEG